MGLGWEGTTGSKGVVRVIARKGRRDLIDAKDKTLVVGKNAVDMGQTMAKGTAKGTAKGASSAVNGVKSFVHKSKSHDSEEGSIVSIHRAQDDAGDVV